MARVVSLIITVLLGVFVSSRCVLNEKAETNRAVGELSSVVLATGYLYMGVCVLQYENV